MRSLFDYSYPKGRLEGIELTYTEVRFWKFYHAYIRPAKEVIQEVGTGLLTECVLRAAGCKRIKPGQFIINWEKKGKESYDIKHKKKFTKKERGHFLGALRAMSKYHNARVKKNAKKVSK